MLFNLIEAEMEQENYKEKNSNQSKKIIEILYLQKNAIRTQKITA